MLFRVLDERSGETREVVLPPLSTVGRLLLELDSEREDELLYIRPTFWAQGLGLHPKSVLPMVLNEYTLNSGPGVRIIDYSATIDDREEELYVRDFLLLIGWVLTIVVTLYTVIGLT